jgi:transposase InsO family protein
MGPLEHPSISCFRYALTFINDYSRRIWVYFLENNYEVFGKFKEFKAFVEKQSGKSIKILRTHNGKEYVNKDFDNYCKYNGIKREHTVPYTHKKNGVVERKNKTLMDMARCMLHARNMNPKFWTEAINIATYIVNRTPTIVAKHKTPKEAWSRRKLIIGQFKVFGCDAYVHIPDEKRKKLDRKIHKCIMVG